MVAGARALTSTLAPSTVPATLAAAAVTATLAASTLAPTLAATAITPTFAAATFAAALAPTARVPSWLEAAVAARLVQGLQPARGRDRDGRLVNGELVLIGSAVEARRQAWPVEEGSRRSRAVAVRRSGTKASASTRQAERRQWPAAKQRARAERPHPTPPTQSPDPGRVAHSSADHRAPAPCQL